MRIVAKLLAVWLVVAALVSVAALFVRHHWPSELELFDRTLIDALSQLQSHVVRELLRIPSLFGTVAVLTPLIGATFVALLSRDRAAAWKFLIAVSGSALHYLLLNRLIFSRARPVLATLDAGFEYESFPSGHALLLLTFAVSLTLVLPVSSRRARRGYGALLIAVALLLGLSRIVLVAHHPSDVIAGWVLSLGWVFGLHAMLGRRELLELRLRLVRRHA